VNRPRLIGTVTAVRKDVAAAELVVLGPSLGTTTALWDDVAHDLAADFRVLRFDLPGHGASPIATESFSVGDLADAVRLHTRVSPWAVPSDWNLPPSSHTGSLPSP
jgi:pimeloyl-ACP methyl ester carboxylesterase